MKGIAERKGKIAQDILSDAAGKSYVTARGWEDLSQMLLLYEEEDLAVTQELVG